MVSGAAAARIFDANQISATAAVAVTNGCREWIAQRGGSASIYVIDNSGLAVHAEKMDGRVAHDMQTALLKAEIGTFTANVTGGFGTIYYQWYKQYQGSNTWITRGTSQSQDETMITTSFTVKVVVTRGSQQAEATRFVEYESGGGPLPKRIANLLPEAYGLHQNHPNPFNPSTILRYDLPEASRASLTIYDLAGRELRRWDTQEQPGYLQVVWDGRNEAGQAVPTGIYIYRLVATSIKTGERFVANRKMVLLK